MRQGIIQTALNVIIALVGVAVIFSASFYVYETVIQSISGPKVMDGFESFVKPIASACNGKAAFTTDVMLPLNTKYTYGVVQTRVRKDDELVDPLMRNACTDSYCLCLFRMPKKEYNTWDLRPASDPVTNVFSGFSLLLFGKPLKNENFEGVNEPAPLWHFNTPGAELFPLLIQRMLSYKLFELFARITYKITLDLMPKLTCCLMTAYLGCALCSFLITVISTTLTEELVAYQLTFQQETTEPLLVVNFPRNFMFTNQTDKLYWTTKDRTFSCDTVAMWGDKERQLNTYKATASASAAMNRGFILGLYYGVADLISIPAISGLIMSTGEIINFYEKLTSGRFVEAARNQNTVPSNMNPDCYVLDLLSARLNLNLARWVRSGKEYTGYANTVEFNDLTQASNGLENEEGDTIPSDSIKSLSETRDYPAEYMAISESEEEPGLILQTEYDDGVYNMQDLDIVNCVSISDLGPLCNSETKVLMDFNYDWYYYYKILDPMNSFQKSIFCEYSQKSTDYEVPLLSETVKDVTSTMSFLPSGMGDDLSSVISDYLGGATSINGMLMECGYPGVIKIKGSKYLQYWIPYFDKQGIMGYDGQIPYMTAELVDYTHDEEVTCRERVKDKITNCYGNQELLDCFINCRECSLDKTVDCKDDSNCDYATCSGWLEKFSYDDCAELIDEEGESTNIPAGFDSWDEYFTTLSEKAAQGISTGSILDYNQKKCDVCYDLYYEEFLECTSGIHLKTGGVLI